MITRRSFLAGILAGAAAPAFVRSESLMGLWVPKEPQWVGFDLGAGADITVLMKWINDEQQRLCGVPPYAIVLPPWLYRHRAEIGLLDASVIELSSVLRTPS